MIDFINSDGRFISIEKLDNVYQVTVNTKLMYQSENFKECIEYVNEVFFNDRHTDNWWSYRNFK